jgi:hypothetical protein
MTQTKKTATTRKAKSKPSATAEELLRDMMIIQLGLAGVSQDKIRTIVGVDNNRVSAIVRHLRKGEK